MAKWSAKVNYGQSNIIAHIRPRVWEICDQSRTSSYHRYNHHAEAGGHPIEDSDKIHLLHGVASQSTSGHPRILYQHILLRVMILNLSFWLPTVAEWRVRSGTDLLPFHSCSSVAAKSTQTVRSGCSYDPLVSAYRGCEPAGSSSQRLLHHAWQNGPLSRYSVLTVLKSNRSIRGYVLHNFTLYTVARRCSIDQ